MFPYQATSSQKNQLLIEIRPQNGVQKWGSKICSLNLSLTDFSSQKLTTYTTSLQIPPDFYQSKFRQESKPIPDNEFYEDNKDQDK